MVSAVTVTEEQHEKGFRRVQFDWTGHTDGVVTKVATTKAYTGKVEVLITDPDDTDAPTDNYDVTVTDDEGYDILAGAGADRDTLNTETVLSASLGAVFESTIGPVVVASGVSKKGKIVLLIR
jgi:hypothetical protein